MENNILIAEFMSWDIKRPTTIPTNLHLSNLELDNKEIFDLKFHTSWDWLMLVVGKIERDEKYDVEILQYGTRILERTKKHNGLIEVVSNIANISFENKIENTYDAIVQFINQYNKTK